MRKLITLPPTIFILLIVLVSCDPTPASPEPVIDLDWPQTRRTPEQIGSLDSDVNLPLQLAWSVRTDCKSTATPILAFETLYVGCSDGKLYALNPINGETLFTLGLIGSVAGMAAAPAGDGFSGAILITTETGGRLYAIDPYQGTELWHLEDGYGNANSPPTVVDARAYYTIMINEQEGCIRSVSVQSGSILWQECHDLYEIFGPPVLYDGVQDVLWSAHTSSISQYNAETGQHVWAFLGYNTTPAYFHGPIGVSSADEAVIRLLVRGHDTELATYRIPVETHQGGADWLNDLPFEQVIIGAAITENRSPNFLVVSQREYLYSLDAQTGEILAQTPTVPNDEWQFNHRTPQPVIWGNFVFHVSDSTNLVAYDLENLNELWRYDLGMQMISSPIISGNAMFITTLAGTVYAFCSE